MEACSVSKTSLKEAMYADEEKFKEAVAYANVSTGKGAPSLSVSKLTKAEISRIKLEEEQM
jgi:hypothetical protein